MPTLKYKILRFKNHNNKERVPFIVYAEFECLLKPTRDENAYQKHEAFRLGHYLKCSYDDSLFIDGLIDQVDLEYPVELHDPHKDLPLCPEHESAPECKQKKLTTTRGSKTEYILHYRNPKQALNYGLKLECIH